MDAYYMGNQSLSRQRFHSQRMRRDSQGRDYCQERQGRNDSRGRQFHRRYYRRDSRNTKYFLWDMRSFSRPRSNSKEDRGRSSSRREDKRSMSREKDKGECKTCIGYKCEFCMKMRKNAKEINVNLCEGYAMNEEFLVNYTEKGKQGMEILGPAKDSCLIVLHCIKLFYIKLNILVNLEVYIQIFRY